MIKRIVDQVERSIKLGRHKHLTGSLLVVGYGISFIPGFHGLRSIVTEGMMLAAEKAGDFAKAERILLEYAVNLPLKPSLLKRYASISRFGFTGILHGRNIDPEKRAALNGAAFYARGQFEEAINEFSRLQSSVYDLKYYAISMMRSIYHQKRDYENVALTLTDLLRSEPKRILINEAIAAAGAAEAARREDLFAHAITRILTDSFAITNDTRLFKRYWRDAYLGAITTFDIDRAISIADKATAQKNSSRSLLTEILALRDDLAPIAHVVKEAHADVLLRSKGLQRAVKDADAVVVMPGAAVRANKLDYPGFRQDIRACLKQIVATLEAEKLRFQVRSRIQNHGIVEYNVPYFSYHTISNDGFGLHYKETDRRSFFSFDEQGYAGWSRFSQVKDYSDFSVEQSVAESFFLSDRDEMVASRLSKYQQKDLAEVLPDQFIFIGLQVVGDAVQSLAYATPFEMMDEIIAVAQKNGIGVVVKRHPACKSNEITRYLDAHSSEITLARGNIHDLIPASAAVCVINSGVGAEALIYRKPVYIFGQADYMSACFVCKEQGDFDKLFVLGRTKLEDSDLMRFWYHYRKIYACDLRLAIAAAEWITMRVRGHMKASAYVGQNRRLRQ